MEMIDAVPSIIAVVLLYAAIQVGCNLWSARREIRNVPGFRVLINNSSILGFLMKRPRTGVAVGSHWTWLCKYKPFQLFKLDIISAVSAFPAAETIIWVADVSASKEILTNRTCFSKPTESYALLDVFGKNIISSEGEEWKKHRKVCAPSFSESNNALVWTETIEVINDLFQNIWGEKEEVAVDNMVKITHSIAVYVISRAGFGRKVGWQDGSTTHDTHRTSFKQSLRTVSGSLFFRVLLPSWIYRWAPFHCIQHVRYAFDDFESYLIQMMHARQTSNDAGSHHDILSMLLRASDDDIDENTRFSYKDLLGNTFTFLIAGHETTAHTMALALGLLGVYQEEQDLLYRQLKEVLLDIPVLTYRDAPKLTRCAAVINETLRLYPQVQFIPKRAQKETILTTVDPFGRSVHVTVPKGADVAVNISAIHYNPRYWENPEEFKPSRFLGEWDRDAFLPFGMGPRSCLGRRFAELELIAAICCIVSRYKIDMPDEEKLPGETLQERRDRILKCEIELTLAPINVPLLFKRR